MRDGMSTCGMRKRSERAMLGYLTSDVAVEAGACAVQAEGVGVVLLIAWLLLAEVLASRFGAWAERRCMARAAHAASDDARSGDGSVENKSGNPGEGSDRSQAENPAETSVGNQAEAPAGNSARNGLRASAWNSAFDGVGSSEGNSALNGFGDSIVDSIGDSALSRDAYSVEGETAYATESSILRRAEEAAPGSAVGRSGGSVEELVGGMRHRNLTNPWRIAACAAAGVIGVWMLARGDSLVAVGLALLVVLVMAEAVRCDVAHRLVPRELCALMAVAGGAFQLLAFGWATFAGALVFAACAIALCCALSFLVRRLSDEEATPPLGGGDVRCIGAIAIATGRGAFLALGAGAIAAALFCTVRFVVRSPNRRRPIPLAPFLMLGLMVGLVACL